MSWSESPNRRDLENLSDRARSTYGTRLISGISETRALLAALVVAVIIAVALSNGLTVNGGGLIVLAWMVYQFAPVDQVRAREVGVLFRRFSKSPDSDSFCASVSVATRGICNFFTIQDASYTGDGSIRKYLFAYLLAFFYLSY
jgi:hypothetical protein